MKRFVYSVALVTAIMFGFSSCDEDDETSVDVKEQAVGTYNVKVNYYVSNGKQWDNSDFESGTDTGNAFIEGDKLKITIDDETYSFVKIAEASNGFTFDVEDYSFVDEGVTYTFKGLNGIELVSKKDGSSTKFNGAYFSDTKTLMFRFELPKEQFSAMLSDALSDNEDFMAPLLEIAGVDPYSALDIADKIEELLSKLSLIVEFVCVQK